ncbi:MAG TPA: MMPL family transporter [Candidatus Eisenbacteria bacterium]|nr:MMPL family transporter [Candidatus Eisenbacteria bacterium]
MATAFERYVRLLVRFRWLVLAVVAALTVLVGSGMTKLRSEFSVEASLPANHPFVQIDKEIRAEFGGRRTLIVAIVPREGEVWQTPVLEIVRDFTLAALRLPDIMAQNVVSLAAPAVRYVEESGGSIKVDYLMRDAPKTPEEIARLRAKVESDPQLRGMLVTPDQKAAIVVLDFFEGKQQSWEVANAVLALAEPYHDRGVDVWIAGEPTFALTDLDQSAMLMRRIPVTFLVIAVMLLVSFRSFQGMFIPMLTATLSTVWGLGLQGHTGIPIDGWNAAVPILLIAVAAAHSAQMLKRYVEEVVRTRDNRAAVIESTVKIGPVMVAAGATAALGFASLALFGVRSIANFGLSCAYGIGSAVFLELTLIPALRAVLPAPKHVPPEGGVTTAVLATLERAILRGNGRPVLIGTAIALVLSLVGIARIRTFGPTREYMPKGSLPRVHLDEIQKHFPGTVTMTILYEGAEGSAKTVPFLQHMAAMQAELEKDPLVLRTASLADLVKTLHKTFAADAPNPYRVPDDQELVSQLMFLGDSPAFERFVDRAQTKAIVMAYLTDDDSALVGPLVRHTEAWLRDHPPPDGVKVLVAGGAGPTILAVNEHTTYGKLVNMVVVLLAIYAISSTIMRSATGGLYVVCPIVVTVIELFGILGWTGVRFDMGSSSVISMAAGIGADYAIYFLYRLREERKRSATDAEAFGIALRTSGRAVLFVAASIGAGFSVEAISPYLGMRLFGTLMPLAMLLSCFAALSLMPVLVLRTRPRFIFGHESTPVVSPMPSVAASG